MKTLSILVALTALATTSGAVADTYIKHRPGADIVYIKGKHHEDRRRQYHHRDDHPRSYRSHRSRSASLGIAITYPLVYSGYRPYSTYRPYRGSAYREGYTDGYREGFRDGKRVTERHGPRSRNW
ncbi:MAG: hypothetical protein ACFHX7_02155 [Pseudomonadota bacterium]